MASFNYPAMRGTADKLIMKFGAEAALRRNGVDRVCWVVLDDIRPREAANTLANPTDYHVIMSAGLGDVPTTPPDNEQDQLVTSDGQVRPFTSPVKPISPAGVVVVYEFTVRR
jgi:hypothetical protein